MRIHFISIGGAVMHNLALELKANGHEVTGSDDEIYSPSRERLQRQDLLPQKMGWFPERIHNDIDLILLGMHARPNNPELIKAQELGLKINSFPEFIGAHALDKKQVVIAGSHGKTTTTSMIMHILLENKIEFDYLVGAQLDGFDRMVKLSNADIIIIEGDEYLSSPIDRQPKFLHYHPDILVLTGVQWDHMNVFPTFDSYVAAFLALLQALDSSTQVFYDAMDANLVQLITKNDWHFPHFPYQPLNYHVENGKFIDGDTTLPLQVIGRHNMKNLSVAKEVARALGLNAAAISPHLATFLGASKRQDVLVANADLVVIRDFAHAPSKVKATLDGVRELYPDRPLIAVCELHTFSSLNIDFLPEYKNALTSAESACVFFSPKTLEIKRLTPLDHNDIRHSFHRSDLEIMTNSMALRNYILNEKNRLSSPVILLMSSGTFGGLDLNTII